MICYCALLVLILEHFCAATITFFGWGAVGWGKGVIEGAEVRKLPGMSYVVATPV